MKSPSMLLCLFALPSLAASLLVSADPKKPAPLKNPDYVSEGFLIACPKEEYERYRVVLCSKALDDCESDWCRDHKMKWTKKFGACTQYGCEANPYADSK